MNSKITAKFSHKPYQRYVAFISYFGRDYCGWQIQDREQSGPLPSIQETLEKAILAATQIRTSAHGSGRTDAGVHAVAQVAHFDLPGEIRPCIRLRGAINAHLPKEIRIWKLSVVDRQFSANRSATKKAYSYYITQGPSSVPWFDQISHWIPHDLRWPKMRVAAKQLIGTHDFRAFQGRDGKRVTTVRMIHSIKITRAAHFDGFFSIYRIQVTGSGFLKHMVRSIVGTLVRVGEGKKTSKEVRRLLTHPDRREVGPTVPAKGLWLERVWYGRTDFL